MKKILFSLLNLFLITNIFGQRIPIADAKCGDIWMHGYQSFGHTQYPDFGVSDTDFTQCDNNQYYKYSDLDIKTTCATIADTSGKLLFFTNGYTIGDSSRRKMLNGDSLCIPDNTYPNGSYVIEGAIIIPLPSNPYLYQVFHHAPSYNSSVSVAWGFLETTVDIRGNNGKGVVIQKNKLRLRDTSNGVFMKFCRHANGRDWWMIRAGWSMHKYHRFLLTPHGLDSFPPQIMPYPPVGQRGNIGLTNLVTYSSDGSKLAHKLARVGIWLYDFDRCSGLLNNRQFIPRQTSYLGEFATGIAFSPNGRYLYCTVDTAVIQYDTQAPNIAASATTVGIYDHTTIKGGSTKFYIPTLAPDGKIYISGPGGCQMWHTIHNPDGAGLSCNLRLHDRTLTTLYYGTSPNQANFRLGALIGSGCDTLNIAADAPYICIVPTENPLNPPKGELLKVFPNPTSGVLHLTYPTTELPKRIVINDILGHIVAEYSSINTNEIQLSTQLANGVYALSIYYENNIFLSTKFVLLR